MTADILSKKSSEGHNSTLSVNSITDVELSDGDNDASLSDGDNEADLSDGDNNAPLHHTELHEQWKL